MRNAVDRCESSLTGFFMDINGLVGGAITILKNMSSSMGRMTSHISWKNNPVMFQTTNQMEVDGGVPNHGDIMGIYFFEDTIRWNRNE